jgi:hypothetical protein
MLWMGVIFLAIYKFLVLNFSVGIGEIRLCNVGKYCKCVVPDNLALPVQSISKEYQSTAGKTIHPHYIT